MRRFKRYYVRLSKRASRRSANHETPTAPALCSLWRPIGRASVVLLGVCADDANLSDQSPELDMSEWMTAREAAKLLKVTDRMIGHYAAQGKLQVRREGRRVWYFSEDVQKMASELQTDLRPAQITRQDVNEGMVRYIQERAQKDQEILDRLDRIDARLNQPAPVQPQRAPSWQVIVALVLVLAIALVVLAIVVRFF